VNMRLNNQKGFTLIELLVVIAIIGILSSLVLVSMSGARAKARDARKMDDLKNVNTALNIFYNTYERMPRNYNPGWGAYEGDGYYEQSMQELVDAKILAMIPKTPGGYRYAYYDYGPGNEIGALLVTALEGAPDSTVGISPSCRPWAAGINWCSKASNKYYCLCNPY